MTKFTERNIIELSPQILAFIGDGVHTAFVREWVLSKMPVPTMHRMHLAASNGCKAATQSAVMEKLIAKDDGSFLKPDEISIVMRARNAHTANVPKGASIEEYHKATAFEALLGYCYLLGRKERLDEFLALSVDGN